MSDEGHANLTRDLELALLRKALLSAVAATNAAFEAVIASSDAAHPGVNEALDRAVGRGTEHLGEALAYIQEAQDVRHRS